VMIGRRQLIINLFSRTHEVRVKPYGADFLGPTFLAEDILAALEACKASQGQMSFGTGR